MWLSHRKWAVAKRYFLAKKCVYFIYLFYLLTSHYVFSFILYLFQEQVIFCLKRERHSNKIRKKMKVNNKQNILQKSFGLCRNVEETSPNSSVNMAGSIIFWKMTTPDFTYNLGTLGRIFLLCCLLEGHQETSWFPCKVAEVGCFVLGLATVQICWECWASWEEYSKDEWDEGLWQRSARSRRLSLAPTQSEVLVRVSPTPTKRSIPLWLGAGLVLEILEG